MTDVSGGCAGCARSVTPGNGLGPRHVQLSLLPACLLRSMPQPSLWGAPGRLESDPFPFFSPKPDDEPRHERRGRFTWEAAPTPTPAAGAGAQARPSQAQRYHGWDLTTAVLDQALREHAPVHGLLGFSQGATAAALYMAAGGARELAFGILISGFLPRDESAAATLSPTTLAGPTLHVMGGADDIIPVPRSHALAERCGRPTLFQHPGGHMVPTCSGDAKQALVDFLDGPATQAVAGLPGATAGLAGTPRAPPVPNS